VHVAKAGQDQQRSVYGTAGDRVADHTLHTASSQQKSLGHSPSAIDGDLISHQPSSPPVPSVKHRLDTGHSRLDSRQYDVQSRTAHASGIHQSQSKVSYT